MSKLGGGLRFIAAGAGLVLLAVSGCSSSGSGGAAVSTSGSAKGSSILLGTELPIQSQTQSLPEILSGIQASISAVNASGGLNGHKLSLDFCDTQNDPNQEISCARKLISDHVAAVVSPEIIASSTGTGAYTLFQRAGVPVIGAPGLGPADMDTPGVFPLSSGLLGWFYGATANLLKSGATKIAFLRTSEPGPQFTSTIAAQALKLANIEPVHVVTVNTQADPTFAAGAAEAVADGVDGIELFVNTPTDVPKAVLALRQAGFTGKISTATALLTPPVIKALGNLANGILLTSQVALPSETSNPAVADFLSDMKKYQPSSTIDEETILGWGSVQLLKAVLAHSTNFGASDILAAFNNLRTPVDIGISGPFVVVGTKPISPAYQRVFSETVQNGMVQQGVVVATGGFVNPFNELKQIAATR